jgi:predicted SAM-dependent methyltransferase
MKERTKNMTIVKCNLQKARSFLRYLRLLIALKFKKNNIQIIIGAAGTNFQGWLSTDRSFLDLTDEQSWKVIFSENSIKSILAEHVWEHLTEEQAIEATRICYKYLKKEGNLRIAVPDGYHPKKSYIEEVKPGGSGAGADDHKVLYNYVALKRLLESAGFVVNLREYFDESGNFVQTDWCESFGRVQRSKNNDPRNLNDELNYTSIIVDAIK